MENWKPQFWALGDSLCSLFWFFRSFSFFCVEGVFLSHSYTFTNRGQRTGRQATREETLDRLHAAQSIQWADRITRKPVTPDSIALVQLPSSRHTMERERQEGSKIKSLGAWELRRMNDLSHLSTGSRFATTGVFIGWSQAAIGATESGQSSVVKRPSI